MTFKLRESNEVNAMIELMQHNDQFKDDPYVGSFWYDPDKDELFGVYSVLARDSYDGFDSLKIALNRELRKHSERSLDYYMNTPHGVVIKSDDRFFVYTGKWINNYECAKDEIMFEFQLPNDRTEFIIC